MPTTLGLDLAKRTTWYAAVATGDRLIEDGQILSRPRDVVDVARRVKPETILVEASGVTAWCVDALREEGFHVWPVHPASLPSRRSRRKKTDRVDARLLVRLHRAGVLTKAWIPPRAHRRLRDLARTRVRLGQDRTQYRNRIHQALNQDAVRLKIKGKVLTGHRLFTQAGQRLALKQRPDLAPWYHAHDLIAREMKRMTGRIQTECLAHDETKRLLQVPGFGPLVSLALHAEIGPIDRFPSAKHLVSYLGLDPMVEQSGDTVKQLGISHRGPGWIRGLLTQAAWTHVRFAPDSVVTKKFVALSKRVGKGKAMVATARRLVKVAYWILRDETDYDSTGRTP